MPLLSAFTPCGHLAMSSKPAHGERIYNALRANLGDDYSQETDSNVQADLYATAMCIASAKYTLERAANNSNPLKATELLPKLERDHLIVPNPAVAIEARRANLAARMMLSRGARRENVEDLLRTLLGDDFIAYETTAPADIETWPPSPGAIGNWVEPRVAKIWKTQSGISVLGSPIGVALESINDSEPFTTGESVCVEPDARGRPEHVTVTQGFSASIIATFTRAHDPATIITNQRIPLRISNQRYARIVVSAAASIDTVKRRQVNEIMKRVAQDVSIWGIVSDEGTFLLEHATRSRLDATGLA